MADASLVLGIVNLFVWMLPLLGFPIGFAGVIVGVIAVTRLQSRNTKSIIGLIFSSMGFLLSIINYWAAMFTPLVL